ncbi:hypothetical protein trd_0007 [Thermomicrobium roseum DSM 5159]|uniref:Uncharacterized protein n=1 Tax=Thermomicrobium roseum (strain ATCC 27502 / DSM 5159 / P-2) TaxID=309801 RepID=B9L1A6_THERP|nr:hypothetical protein trd_0007 [Thermomicrobium roseum DSM 5159]
MECRWLQLVTSICAPHRSVLRRSRSCPHARSSLRRAARLVHHPADPARG